MKNVGKQKKNNVGNQANLVTNDFHCINKNTEMFLK